MLMFIARLFPSHFFRIENVILFRVMYTRASCSFSLTNKIPNFEEILLFYWFQFVVLMAIYIYICHNVIL